jgi:hypothetical protein
MVKSMAREMMSAALKALLRGTKAFWGLKLLHREKRSNHAAALATLLDSSGPGCVFLRLSHGSYGVDNWKEGTEPVSMGCRSKFD